MSDQAPQFLEWQQWEWSKEHQRYYCWRRNAAGHTEYWWNGDPEPQVVSNSQPRTVPTESQQPTGSTPSAQSPQQAQAHYLYTTPSSPQNEQYRGNYSHTAQPHHPHSQAYHVISPYYQTPTQQHGQSQLTYGQASTTGAGYGQHPPYGTAAPSGKSMSQTPTPAQPQQRKRKRHLENTANAIDAEILNPEYKIISAKNQGDFFKRGRVFSTLWTEPSGPSNADRTACSSYSKVKFGGTAFTEIRRFVVVRNKGQFSQCIPIQTYSGQGTLKAGVLVEDHAIIYCGQTDDDEPEPLEGEELDKTPLRVIPSPGITLHPTSRINFGKTYTVEHNLKVCRIGKIDNEHIVLLMAYWKAADDRE